MSLSHVLLAVTQHAELCMEKFWCVRHVVVYSRRREENAVLPQHVETTSQAAGTKHVCRGNMRLRMLALAIETGHSLVLNLGIKSVDYSTTRLLCQQTH